MPTQASQSDKATRPAVLLVGTVLAFAGCGGDGSPSPPSQQAVTITVQPVSQVVPLGETATFTVTATGTAPLSYQWSEDGQPIAGATGASYITPPVAPGANGTAVGTFEVRVSNASSSATSKAVALAVGPRSPKPGDIRYLSFQQVSLPGFMGTAGGEVSNLGAVSFSFANSLGTGLWLGEGAAGPCTWHFNAFFLPPPMNNMAMYYQEDFLQTMPIAAYLQSIASPYLVVTSMDIQPGASCDAMGVSWIETAQGGFDQRLEVVPPPQLQTQAIADGQASRIITAVSFDASGNVNLLSYGWTGDTTTVYETQTYLVPLSQVGPTATTLAADGYFISAFGGDNADGYILVGARVKGDTLPRPMNINGVVAPNPDTNIYFTPVVMLDGLSGNQVEAWEQ
jgi:hypothetical protein